jgi:ABC-type multidrug transport system ATPase subunit
VFIILVSKGHNGAGKSTTISMICGLYEPSAGQILVDNYNVVTETKKARSKVGYCPQHNLLFDDLTVHEHLVFFSKLKDNYNEDEIADILNGLNLADKAQAQARTLSGGMKR